MSIGPEDSAPPAAEPVARRRRLAFEGTVSSEAVVAGAALFLSLTLALLNALDAIRGSSIVVLPPERVLLYRDTTPSGSVLWAATKVSFINAAGPQYGDVVRRAELEVASPGGATTRFDFDSVVEPVVREQSMQAAAERCDLNARCIGLEGLLVVDRSDPLLDLPGGQARSDYLAFPLVEWNCGGERRDCAAFGAYDKSLAAMRARRLNLTLELRFHSDGRRRLRCVTEPLDLSYLEEFGWTSVSCTRSRPR